MKRRKFGFLLFGSGLGVPESRAMAGAGWQIRFNKVHDLLKLYAGAPPAGRLISWPDRGKLGKFSWCWEDKRNEARDVDTWAPPDQKTLTLFAEISKDPNGTGNQLCELEVLYKLRLVERWEFSQPSSKVIAR